MNLDGAVDVVWSDGGTSRAVLSIALDRPTPIVDGNVERVFSRLFLLDGVRTSPPLLRAAWEAGFDLPDQPGPVDMGKVTAHLRDVLPDELTPREALSLIYELKELAAGTE